MVLDEDKKQHRLVQQRSQEQMLSQDFDAACTKGKQPDERYKVNRVTVDGETISVMDESKKPK